MVSTRWKVLVHRTPEHVTASHLSGIGRIGKDRASGYTGRESFLVFPQTSFRFYSDLSVGLREECL